MGELYNPLWLYSLSPEGREEKTKTPHFTIHSGYILSQIIRPRKLEVHHALQSTLVIFSHCCWPVSTKAVTALQSTLVIFSQPCFCGTSRPLALYNPLWLYSLVDANPSMNSVWVPFTIHSGYILSGVGIDSLRRSFTLQSTLVIFSR